MSDITYEIFYTRTLYITLGVTTFLITFTNYENKPWRKTTMIGLNKNLIKVTKKTNKVSNKKSTKN